MILPKLASVDGKLQSAYYQIQDGDVVELMDYYTVLQIAEFMDVSAESIKNVWVNHEKAGLDTKVYHNFSVSFEMTDGSDAENEMDSSDEITDNVAETSTINTSSEIADISSESVNTSSEKNAKYMMTNTDEATIDKITGNKITENKTIVNKTTVDKTANDKTTANHTVKSATTQAVDNSNETSALSALEKAKQNAQKTIEKLQFEHAEESLMAMIQSAMNPESAKTSDTASDKISVKAAPLKIDKSAKELYSSIQSNISRIKSGEDIVQIRKEAIEVPPILPPPTVEGGNGKTTQTIHVLVNGKPVTLKGKADYIYVDVFEFYEFDLSKPQGKAVVTMINGRDAQYVEPLSNGDELQIYWRD